MSEPLYRVKVYTPNFIYTSSGQKSIPHINGTNGVIILSDEESTILIDGKEVIAIEYTEEKPEPKKPWWMIFG